MGEDMDPGAGRTVVSFVRRGTRMTAVQRRWLQTYRQRWVVEVAREENSTIVAPQPELDLVSVFGGDKPLIVEIGCGHGDALVAGASAHPETCFLGFEVFQACLAACLGRIAAGGLENVRLIAADAVSGLTHLIPDQRLDELWVFFPDPWPKTRHHKRRLISDSFADLASRKLVMGGKLRLATDADSYADAMTEILKRHPCFELISTERFKMRPVTKFEARGLTAGRTIHDFTYLKRGQL